MPPTKPQAAPAPKGHWPAGKRRKPAHAGVSRAEAELARQIEQRGRNATARLLGVADRTVSRWATGERHPTPEECRRIMELARMP